MVKISLYRPGQNLRAAGKLRLQGFQDIRCMKAVRLSALRMKSIKNPNDTIINRNLDLPAWGAVPQPTSSPRIPEAAIEN